MPPSSLHPRPTTLSLPLLHSSLPKQSLQIPPTFTFTFTNPSSSSSSSSFASQLIAPQGESTAGFGSCVVYSRTEWETGTTLDERRRRRRGRRRNNLDSPVDRDEDEMDEWLFGSEKSRTLTRRQEAALSQFIKEEAMLSGSVCTTPLERRNRDKILLRARASEERIMLTFKFLVISIASSSDGNGLSLDDLVQEGCVGLLRGVRKFDPQRGNRLSTYVYWWIKQAIVRAIANNSRLIRIPVNLCEAMNKVMDANSILKTRLGRCPTYCEIADFVGLSVSSVRIIIQKGRAPISLDLPINSDGLTLKDIIPGTYELRPETILTKQIKLENMVKLLKKLSEREECIIRLRYGLNGEPERTFDEIGRLINLTGERTRQIHGIALRRLREEKSLIDCLLKDAL